MLIAVILCASVVSYPILVNGLDHTALSTDEANRNNSFAKETDNPIPAPTAEKLVRYRRQPPFAIVKHITRSTKRSKQRRRIKGPKIKYGPPTYHPSEPITYYKSPSYSSSDTPSFSLDDIHHIQIGGDDLKVPPSSYEGQSMNLDFYNSNDDGHFYEASKPSSNSYTFKSEPEVPAYTYESPEQQRIPHEQYGIPQQHEYSTGFNTISSSSNHNLPSSGIYESPESFVSSHYVPPPAEYSTSKQQTYEAPTKYQSYEAPSKHQSYEAPTKYQSYEAPTKYQSYEAPSKHQSYEPPTKYQSYETPSKHQSYDAPTKYESYEAPTKYQSYEAPPKQQSYEAPSKHQSYEAPSMHEIQVPHYGIPADHGSIAPEPIEQVYEKKIPNTGYQQIHHSFGEPPAVQHSSSSDFEISYSPPSYDITLTSYTNNDHPHQPSPSNHHTEGFAEPPRVSHSPRPQERPAHENYLLPSQELPLNQNSKFPTYDFPKSSYEVPIYDPVPFEVSNNEKEEAYPPNWTNKESAPPSLNFASISDSSNNSPTIVILKNNSSDSLPDNHSAGSSNAAAKGHTTSQRKKRKRVRGKGSTPTPSNKHILDVPELQEAFELDKRNNIAIAHIDAATDESHYIEQKRTHKNSITSTSTTPPGTAVNYASQAWRPMNIRTSSKTYFSPTVVPTIRSTPQLRQRLKSGTQTVPTDSSTSSSSIFKRQNQRSKEVTAVTIEKSHSKSYYDGTIAPPKVPTTKPRANPFLTTTRKPTTYSSQSLKFDHDTPNVPRRTTKSVLETTYFKSPLNDKQSERRLNLYKSQNLPKNHKLF